MKRQELFIFRTGIDMITSRYTITLCKYTHDYNNSVEYVVQVYDYVKGELKERDFDNISAAKKRFLFEVENATIFAEE